MPYSVLPAQASDASDIATIMHNAFEDDQIIGHISPNVPREANHAWQVRSVTRIIANAERDGVNYLKAVDDENG